MTGTDSAGDGPANESAGRRSATIRTTVDAPAVVAAAIRPDNTPEIETRVERDARDVEGSGPDDGSEPAIDAGNGTDPGTGVVATTVERDATGGLRTTVDDYVVNLDVAQRVVQAANRHAETEPDGTHHQ